jgi:CheY-like chemotaxis protein
MINEPSSNLGRSNRPPILVAEDSEDDLMILRLAWQKSGLGYPMQVAKNGAEAIEYLKGEGRFADRGAFSLPRLLLLDLNMPRTNGFEVLSWIRSKPGLKRSWVMVLSSSRDPKDIDRAYDLGANAYVVKPGHFDELVTFLRGLEGWWMKVSQSPNLSP